MANIAPFIFFFTIITCSLFTETIATSSSPLTLSAHCRNPYSEELVLMQEDFIDNVYSLLHNLATKSSDSKSTPIQGFYNTTVGDTSPYKAYGSYLCRGDLLKNSQLCHNCVLELTQRFSDPRQIQPECFGAAGVHQDDNCIVQFSNQSTRYIDVDHLISSDPLGEKVSNNYMEYNKTLSTTIEGLIREAAYGNWSTPNFKTRDVTVMGSKEKIYTLVQCTPEISASNCSKCLELLYSKLPGCCNGTQGGLVVHASCLLKYNSESFFGSAYRGFMPSWLHVGLVGLLSIYFLYM